MGKVILTLFIFLSPTLGVSSVFGEVCVNSDGRPSDYTNHYCEKVDSKKYCYIPKLGYPDYAPYYSIGEEPLETLPDTKFSSKYGGCTLSYPKGALSVGLDADKYIKFQKACGLSYDFSTEVNFVSHLYKGGKSIAYSISDTEKSKITAIKTIDKIATDTFKDEVEEGVHGRGIFTHMFSSSIRDSKCTEGESSNIQGAINVYTNLNLELKLNAGGNIVYDDKETQKIEIVPDKADTFKFGGVEFSRADILGEDGEDSLGNGKITIKNSRESEETETTTEEED